MAHVPYLPHLVFPVQPSGSIFVFLMNLARLYGLPQITFKGFGACGPPANHSAKGLEFPHIAKVISRMVWSFRAWRKSFPEWFGISCCKDMEINASA
ncbi:hypothetical protein CBG57_10170 [Prevotella nigrescens]|nr:hypothetical protein CBG57_10170 [Prevotella nigrescens]